MSQGTFFKGKAVLPFLLLLLVLPALVFSGVTGKISGVIKDAATGEKLMGVNIQLVGTTLGGVTDIQGSYFVINVPPGTYSLQATMVGYEKTIITGVRVSSDHTTPVDIALQSTTLAGQEVTVVAEREIVKKDISAAQISSTAEEVVRVPLVSNVQQFVNHQAGIEDGVIRGGGLDQQGFMVDGLIVVDNRSNRPLQTVNMSMIKEVNIMKGGFDAEYGNVRAGMISVVTKDADPNRYSGSLDFRLKPARIKHYGPSMLSKDFFYMRPYLDPQVAFVGTKAGWDEATRHQNLEFEGWNSFSQRLLADKDPKNDRTPQQCYDMFLWEHAAEGSGALGQKESTYGDKPDYLIDGLVAGGVPIIGKKLGNLSFMASYRSDWQAFAWPTSRDYFRESGGSLKLTSRLTSNMKLSVEGYYGETNTVADSREGGSDNSYVTSGNSNYNANIWPGGQTEDHKVWWWRDAAVPFDIYRSMFGITFDHVLSPKTFYNIRISQVHVKNSAKGWGFNDYRDTTTARYFGNTPVDERPWGFWIGTGTTLTTQGDGASLNADGGGHRDNGEVNTVNARFDITSQVNRSHQLKAGIEMNYDDLHTEFERIRFESHWEDYKTAWDQFPWRFGAYVKDKLEFEGMVANIGVRVEYNNPNCDWYTVDAYTKYLSAKYKTQLSSAPTEKAEGQLMVLPRLGISHPISKNVKLYFNYGHFTSLPTSTQMYEIAKGRSSDGITRLGNPNALLPKTVAYELGFEWNVANQFLVQLNGFYRDVADQINEIQFINYTGSVNYYSYNNSNYEDVRGFELRVDKTFGRYFTGWFNYTYPVRQYGFLGRNVYYQDPRLAASTGFEDPNITRSTIQPYLRASVNLMSPNDFGPSVFGIRLLGDWMVSPVFSWRSGDYQTWNPLKKEGVQNDLHWKSRWTADLRVSRRFTVSKTNVELFVDVNNLFNQLYLNTATSAGAFYDSQDYRDYLESLHLPMYKSAEFDALRDVDRGKYIAGDDQVGDVKSSDKPYIDMPNRDFMYYQDLRYVTFGLRVDL
jgi:outer membrane receptor protein involved in Fe transport